MIDAYAAAGTFADKHRLAVDLATAVMTIEQVPGIPMFRKNTAAFVHDLDADYPTLADRTWVLLTEAPDGGWGLGGHANTNEELVSAARAQIAELSKNSPGT
jgi:hypothetical protein